MESHSIIKNFRSKLAQNVESNSICAFRVGLGLVLIYFSLFQAKYLYPKFIQPEFFFSYPGLSFIKPWPIEGMIIHYSLMVITAIGITFGIFYRFSITAFFLLHTYLFLIDASYYKNHHYLIALITFLMIFIPATNAFTFRKSKKIVNYFWQIAILRFQFCVVYFYAGIAKINSDWFSHEPIAYLLNVKSKQIDQPVIQAILQSEIYAMFISTGGLCFDLLAPLGLLCRRTRFFTAILAILFNVINLTTFPVIAPFSLLMMISLIIFFEPNFPLNNQVILTSKNDSFPKSIQTMLTIYILLQIILPLRHHFYPGNVLWTSQGERFSWRMILKREKAILKIKQYDKETKTYRVPAKHLINFRQYSVMKTRPEFILQFVQYLDQHSQSDKIIVENYHSINGRKLQNKIKPNTDFTKLSRFGDYTQWLYPYQK